MTVWMVADEASGNPPAAICAHLGESRQPTSSTASGCEDCLRDGSRWVHLRQCLVCGHVFCCDSSPRRHATAHWRSAGHPLVRSSEPGEAWAWCYADELLLLPATSGH